MSKYGNLIDCFIENAAQYNDKTVFKFLANGEKAQSTFTYQQFDQKVKTLAGKLQEFTAQGERALLLYPISMDYLIAFFACIYAGIIPVPVQLPHIRNQSAVKHIENIALDAGCSLFLSTAETRDTFNEVMSDLFSQKGAIKIATDNVEDSFIENWNRPSIKSDSIAFLQYTSGSTGHPKGVMVLHNGLLHNSEMIKQAFHHTSETEFISWLPFYHDMGIIGIVIQALYLGSLSILMPPMAFLQKPIRWLKLISEYKNVTSGAPNFAYELCCNRISEEQCLALDLSEWKVAFNGSEKVASATIKKFTQKFLQSGFNASALFPTYGLAEATLFVTGGLKESLPIISKVNNEQYKSGIIKSDVSRQGIELVASGYIWDEFNIAIVDPNTQQRCPKGEIGEVWLMGESITKGYWNKPELSQERFKAHILPDFQGPYYRTGDLGYIEKNQLYITGRIKDLIIIRGKNYYPEDIEIAGQSACPEFVRYGGAAFSIEKEMKENIIVVQEIERSQIRKVDYNLLANRAMLKVLEEYNIQISSMVFVKPFHVPRTTSGKIRRAESKKLYESNLFESLADVDFEKQNIAA